MEFVSFEIAKKLKEKGFIEECFANYRYSNKDYLEKNSYNPDTGSVFYCYNTDEDLGRFYIDAPIISQVLKWLREEKKIAINIEYIPYTWQYKIIDMSFDRSFEPYGRTIFSDYEEAALAGIEYVLNNLV
jgi:hypothetical protein